jgi:chorismate mutase
MDAPRLDSLRQEIDAIDGDLHGLIRRRASLVGEITAAKPAGGLALRPGREAQSCASAWPRTTAPFPSPRSIACGAR